MSSKPSSRRIPSEERVFSLVLALVASPYGLTKQELLSSVYGYADRFDDPTQKSSLERQFERDKDEVRRLGVPIETLDSADASGDNRFTRYRISKEQFVLPDNISFNDEELTILRLAALAWTEGSLGEQSKWANLRINSLAAEPAFRNLGIAPNISLHEHSAVKLHQAIQDHVVVEFEYQVPTAERSSLRRIAPLRLHRADARWHLLGFDMERSAARVFLLSRICSAVQLTQTIFDDSLFEHVDQLLAELESLHASQIAVVTTSPGSIAEARLSVRSHLSGSLTVDNGQISFGTLDFRELSKELVSYGDEVFVSTPETLQRSVASLLSSISAQHDSHSQDEAHA